MKKFIITGTYRTGSSALAEIIGLHPDVSCGWEWTNRISWPNKVVVGKRALDGNFRDLAPDQKQHMASVFNNEKQYLGYRRLFRASNKWVAHPKYSIALFIDQFKSHLDWWSQSDISIIHIVRTNNVAWLKSLGLAKAAGSHFGQIYPDKLAVKWDLKEAEKRIIAKNWIDDQLLSLKNSSAYFRLKYEDFVGNNETTSKQVLEFLNARVPYVPSGEAAARVQSEGTKATVENLEELKSYLSQRGLETSKF